MQLIVNRVIAHFDAHRRRSRWSFLWRTRMEALLCTLLVAFAFSWMDNEPGRPDLRGRPLYMLIIGACVMAPLLETLFLQALPISIARVIGWSFVVQVALSTAIFSSLHFPYGIASGLAAGVVGGFYLAFSYAHWIERSFGDAFVITSISHALQNAVVVAVVVYLR